MYHYVYRITNDLNGKFYVGKHSTTDLEDGYMGSGALLSKAISKYGIENFRREIIEFFSTADDALAFEAEIVTEAFVKDPKSYNLRIGGSGSWNFSNTDVDRAQKRREAGRLGGSTWWNNLSTKDRELHKLEYLERMKAAKPPPPDWTGRKHRPETKSKIGVANSQRQKGSGNSNFGKIWINHPDKRISKSIARSELPTWSSQGWVLGRRIKWK